MRGLTELEREILAYVVRWPGHAPEGPRRGLCTPDEARALETLEAAGRIGTFDCVEPCPFSHAVPTVEGRLALLCDSVARGLP